MPNWTLLCIVYESAKWRLNRITDDRGCLEIVRTVAVVTQNQVCQYIVAAVRDSAFCNEQLSRVHSVATSQFANDQREPARLPGKIIVHFSQEAFSVQDYLKRTGTALERHLDGFLMQFGNQRIKILLKPGERRSTHRLFFACTEQTVQNSLVRQWRFRLKCDSCYFRASHDH